MGGGYRPDRPEHPKVADPSKLPRRSALRVVVSGVQGSGKSTLARIIKGAIAAHGYSYVDSDNDETAIKGDGPVVTITTATDYPPGVR